MQLARVLGHATATVKHHSLAGQRLLVVQPLGATGRPDGDPLLALDKIGSGTGQCVLISSDGASVRDIVNTRQTPARWFVIGVKDE